MTGGTLIIVGAFLPFVIYRVFITVRERVFMPYRVAVGDGKEQQAWIMRPKWRKRLNLTRRSRPRAWGMVDPEKRGEPEPEPASGEWTVEVLGIVEDKHG